MKYAVIYKDTIFHEGDERSRTHPGHGYPAYAESVEKIETFESLNNLKKWIKLNSMRLIQKNFTAIQYEELRVSTEVVVHVDG